MGTKYLIEYNGEDKGFPKWWASMDWTTDCHHALQFNTFEEANEYVGGHPFYGHSDAEITEHIFLSPLSSIENLN